MFEVFESNLSGCFEVHPRILEDERGQFIKIFHREGFVNRGMNSEWAEEYYSVSQRGVLRGLHFQLPPHDHAKLVYCSSGEVMDVVVDLRIGSPTFGESAAFRLCADKANMVYIPRGMAHGFYTLSEQAKMHYMVETVYAPEHDAGIRWNSVGIVWPSGNPILSKRDEDFPAFCELDSPFSFNIDGKES